MNLDDEISEEYLTYLLMTDCADSITAMCEYTREGKEKFWQMLRQLAFLQLRLEKVHKKWPTEYDVTLEACRMELKK